MNENAETVKRERDIATAQIEAVLEHLDTAEALGVGVGIQQLRKIILLAGRQTAREPSE